MRSHIYVRARLIERHARFLTRIADSRFKVGRMTANVVEPGMGTRSPQAPLPLVALSIWKWNGRAHTLERLESDRYLDYP